ncbi:Arf-GAP with Rho-GAP domain, ANK repeat and PH domain-containing protein 3 Centaurin-delta-3 [Larimichthys crocea]|uniref:Arf-GAP with Rho-GAP domain, ANK repeat and PH domain-containing protein 3 Centaurin-delta-3 n=1 Tax=Larimichthys crocea TaxID=215358 RepID=A0A6G0I4I3_LARCR|nr:Arf-GAP with Rho-GAP domain, ANK repeat and PH domain-containing protein 3 Centaurin-delta-3 [Larimichthys crocea]
MCAEELTNQVLFMRNVPAGDKDVWMTFEAIEDGQLERPLHPKEKVLEQALQWCKMADPSSAYLVVKRVPKGASTSSPNRRSFFRGTNSRETFQIKDHKLLLLKDKKSIKPEKEWSLKSMKIYIGIRRKLKAPSRWGFTVMSDKHQLFLCCSSEPELWDWITSFLKAQNDDPGPPVLRRHSSSTSPSEVWHNAAGSDPRENYTTDALHVLSHEGPAGLVRGRSESPDLPEPLYEEVGDFGLQVLKSLETSFLSSSAAETQEVPDHPPLRLVPVESVPGDHMIVSDPVQIGSVDPLEQSEGGEGEADSPDLNAPRQPPVRRQQLQGVCSPSQELLLQELSSAFTRRPRGAGRGGGEAVRCLRQRSLNDPGPVVTGFYEELGFLQTLQVLDERGP